MKVLLNRRSYGVHKVIKEVEVEGELKDYIVKVKKEKVGAGWSIDHEVDEKKLLNNLPKGFLPVKAENVLLIVGDKHGGTAVSDPKEFRAWAKYFDAYSVEITDEDK